MPTMLETVAKPAPLAVAVFHRLRERQRGGAASPITERLAVIRRLRQLLPSMEAVFVEALQADIHKPRAETIAAELLPTAAACQYLEKRARRILRPRTVSFFDTPNLFMGERDVVVRRPRGVVGIIGTWNYPLFLSGVQIVQALAAGNVVIWKPSEIAPRTAQATVQWLR
ncbi:MAG TPA: aldehyde dehydrogenase family protein, partial [Gemmatales bacterium]|nr:aldehyde dehydrogenase family protein [Gemmatales bacterium]